VNFDDSVMALSQCSEPQRAPAERLCAFTLTVDLWRLRFGDGGRGPLTSPHLGSPDGNMDKLLHGTEGDPISDGRISP
jgi:hypothetical protein